VVTINGVELSDLWARAKQQPTDPLPTAEVGMGLARLGSIPRVAASLRGTLGAEVRTGADLHVWRVRLRWCLCPHTFDLGTGPGVTPERHYEQPVDLGPFRFKRQAYEAALQAH